MRKCFQEKPIKQGFFEKHFLAVVHPTQWAAGGGQHLSPICHLWRWTRRVGNLRPIWSGNYGARSFDRASFR